MSKQILIIGNLTPDGQPLISGLGFSLDAEEEANRETTEVEIHETVQLVTLASSDEDEEAEGMEEGEIDLKMEEMDRIEGEEEEQRGAMGSEGRRPEASGGVELMATISEEEHAEDISEREEERKEEAQRGERKLGTDRPPIGTEFSEEKVAENEEEKKEEKEPEIEETESKIEQRKMTKEEDEAMQELLKELDEGSRAKEEGMEMKVEGRIIMEEKEEERGEEKEEERMGEEMEEEREEMGETMREEMGETMREETVTKMVEMARNNNVGPSTSMTVEKSIFEQNNVAAEPIGPIQTAAQNEAATGDNAQSPETLQTIPKKEITPPSVPQSNGSPVFVKMRQKSEEKEQIEIEEEKKKPIEIIWREEKKVEIYTETERERKEPEAKMETANGMERVEEVELRRAVEELEEAVQQKPTVENGGTDIGRGEESMKTKILIGQKRVEKEESSRQNGFSKEKENARPVQIQLMPTPNAAKSPHSPASNASSSASAQQNGFGTLGRGPGARSPFGALEPMEEDWRLSPKTLSRIKRLKVVMEGTTEKTDSGAKDAGEVIHHHPIFVKDTSRFWYKPTISREEAINMLKNKPPGTFVVRDSNSFPGAFGLALKVAQPPAGVTPTDGSELVRHFLIEPSTKGVRLKGCSNEPVFGTLAALVYQHSITPLALPCRLILPEYDPASSPEHINSNQALLERGAACNVTYLCSVDTESLTGPEAVRRSAAFAFELLQRRELRAVPVHFKVSSQGITLTDNTRSLFFRRHYPVNSVTFAGIDPESRVFDNNNVSQLPPTYVRQAPIFGYVARKLPANGFNGSVENACHIFAELDPDQPASAVVRFITNVMMPAGRSQLQQIHQNANTH